MHRIAVLPNGWWLLAWLVVLSGQASSQNLAVRTCLSHEWINEAKQFVAEVTNIAVPEVCIRWSGQQQLNTVVAGPVYGRYHLDAAAAFVPARREILLARAPLPGSVIERSYLVHELVHAQQFARGRAKEVTCIGSLEGEAYSVQARYLRRYNMLKEAALFSVIGVMQSACGIDY